ncbi:MAG: O-antigen ligase family protein [Bacteroidia bacterium]|nr:O-antigen ligase family protein [Bacteroidia bacterium]
MKPTFTITKIPSFLDILNFLMVLSLFVTDKSPNFFNLFDFYWFYPLYLLVIGYGIYRLGISTLLNQRWLYFVLIIASTSIISNLIHPYSYLQLGKQIIGWLVIGYAWIIMFKLQKDRISILNTYFSIAIIAAFLTIPEQILHVLDIHITPKKGGWLGLYRCFSFANEPFPLALLLIPCIIYYIEKGSKLIVKEKIYLFLLLTALFFTFSGGGWLVIGIYFIFSAFRQTKMVYKLITGVLFLLFITSFTLYRGTQLRIKETVQLFQNFPQLPTEEVLNQTNTSSRAIYLNSITAWHQFTANPLLGGGLGSHGEAYDESIIQPLEQHNIHIAHFNKFDGASGAIRWFSEMGLFGLLLFGMFVRKILRYQHKELIAPVFGFWIAFLLHSGNYFHNGSMMWIQKIYSR